MKRVAWFAGVAMCMNACIGDDGAPPGSAPGDGNTAIIQRFMPVGDPNLDPTWDWTTSGPGHTIYYTDLNGVIRSKVVQTPFHTGGHTLNTLEKDMYPEDGWMLAFRDFGSPGAASDVPFFALYNKYRGIFRIMLYNTRELTYTRFVLELSFKSTAATGALLTFTENSRSFRDDYNVSKTEAYMVEANSINGWIYADYMLTGYDPTMNPNTQLRLQLRGVDVSQITLESTTFTLSEVLSEANPGGSRTTGSLLDAANQGVKWYNGASKAAKALRDAVSNSSNNTAWWRVPLQRIVGTNSSPTAISNIGSIVSGLIGLVTSFFGSKDDPAPREPLNFTGSLKLNGTSTQSAPLYALDLGLTFTPGDGPPDYYRPVQSIPWGIFNLNTKPTVHRDMGFVCDTDCNCFEDWSFARLTQEPSYVFNAASGLRLVSIEYALTQHYRAPTAFGPWTSASYSAQGPGGTGFTSLSGVAVKLTLKTLTPTRFFDDDLVFYKVYGWRDVASAINTPSADPGLLCLAPPDA